MKKEKSFLLHQLFNLVALMTLFAIKVLVKVWLTAKISLSPLSEEVNLLVDSVELWVGKLSVGWVTQIESQSQQQVVHRDMAMRQKRDMKAVCNSSWDIFLNCGETWGKEQHT